MEYNLTTTQIETLKFFNQENIIEYIEALKTVHYLSTYCVDEELVSLDASRCVQDLLYEFEKIIA